MSEETLEPPKKLTKAKILEALKLDLKSADTLRQEMEGKVEDWKQQYHGKPYGNEQEGKSKLVSRDIKRQDEWQHASVKDPFVSDTDIVKCSPASHEDRAIAEQTQSVLNYQYTRKFNRYKFMTDVIKLYYAEGTVVVKCSWIYEDERVKTTMPVHALHPVTQQPVVVRTEEVETINVLDNRPDAEICRLKDLYLDPTAMGNLDKAQFIIHRYETDLSTLKKTGKYKNLNKLAFAMSGKDINDFEEEDDTNFIFHDQARKKVVAYEYWGNFDVNNDGIAEPIVCTWIEDTIIQMKSNPYPDKKIPFLIVANNSIPFQLYGEATAELVGDNQKVATAIKRGILDNMASSNNAQKGIRKGALDPRNKRRFLNGKNFEYNSAKDDFYDGSYNQLPSSVFDVLSMVQLDSESITGVKSFSGGISGKSLGSTAKASGGVLDAVSVRRLDIVRNIAENLVLPLMRKWHSYNSEFLDEEDIIRITNETFVQPDVNDNGGHYDIEIEVSTAEDNAAKAQELSFLLQTLGQGMDQDMQKLIMGQIAKLNKMPDLAKAIEEHQPQVDPRAERMADLEIEKLEAEIKERVSRANENQVDIRLKSANAALAEARARNMDSNTDLTDQDYIDKESGRDEVKSLAEKDHDRETALRLEHARQLGNKTS